MKRAKLYKNPGNNPDWTIKIEPKYNPRPVKWSEIPMDWNKAEVIVELDKNGNIATITREGFTIKSPDVAIKKTINPDEVIREDQRREDLSEKSHEGQKKSYAKSDTPRKIFPEQQQNQEPLKLSKAPYNFVPLNDIVVPSNNPNNDQSIFSGLSGYIDIEIETLTHLFIKGENFDFFKVGKDYGIPGSSLRGMLRNLIEIVTFGKFENFNDSYVSHRLIGRANDRHFGFLNYDEKNQTFWIIPAAKPSNINPINKHEYILQPNGFIEIHTKGVGQRHQSFKVLYKSNAKPLPLDRLVIKSYTDDVLRNVDSEMGDLVKMAKIKNNSIQKACDRLKIDYIGIPVFYKLSQNRIVSFGHCKNYRIPYENTVGMAGPKSLNENFDIDFATSIFGVSSNNKNINLTAGKVFFEDLSTKETITTPAILQILSAPKIKSPELYLEPQSNGETGKWSQNPKIRGYKYFWHRNTDSYKDKNDDVIEEQIHWQKTRFREKEEFNKFSISNEPEWNVNRIGYGIQQQGGYSNYYIFTKKVVDLKDKSNISKIGKACENEKNKIQFKMVKALPPKTTFKGGRIRFDNLTHEELGALLFVIDLPKNCHHKLGMGKPIGLGSVKLSQTLTLINRQLRYTSLFDENGQWNTGEMLVKNEEYIQAFNDYMNKHLNHGGDLWDHPRMKALKTLLTFDHQVKDSKEYLKATNYMALKEFAKSGILPKGENVIYELK